MDFPEEKKRGYTKITIIVVLAVAVFIASVVALQYSKGLNSLMKGQVEETNSIDGFKINSPEKTTGGTETDGSRVYKSSAEKNSGLKPDFIITDIDYKFNKKPRENFPYYEYAADIKIKNIGDTAYLGSDLFIEADNNQKIMRISNNGDALNLEVGVSEILRDYQILLDKNVEGKTVLTFTLDPENLIQETDEKNNTYAIVIFNEINSVNVEDISLSKGEVTLSWEPPSGYRDLEYQIRYFSEDGDFIKEDNAYKVEFDYQNSFADNVKWYFVEDTPYFLGAAVDWPIFEINPDKKGNKYFTTVQIPEENSGKLFFIIEDKKYAMKGKAVYIEY